MKWPKWGLAGLVGVAGVSFWLLLAGPDRILGLDSGNLGVALAATVAWTALYGVSAAPRSALDDAVSPGEWRAWTGLGFTVLTLAYLVSKSDRILGATDVRDLGGIGRTLVLLLVAWAVLAGQLARRWKDKVLEDERDREIEVNATGLARIALVVAVITVAVTLGLTPVERLAWATPIAVAHVLIFSLAVSCLVEYAATAAMYWRDRRP